MIRKRTAKTESKAAITENKYHVPARYWDVWPPVARATFNETLAQVAHGKDLIATNQSVHALDDKTWQHICWTILRMTTDELTRQLEK